MCSRDNNLLPAHSLEWLHDNTVVGVKALLWLLAEVRRDEKLLALFSNLVEGVLGGVVACVCACAVREEFSGIPRCRPARSHKNKNKKLTSATGSELLIS
jgi:hypothetical protein